MKKTFFAIAIAVLGLLMAAYFKPGPVPQGAPFKVIDAVAIDSLPSFTHKGASEVNVGGFTTVTTWIDYTWASCSQVCMTCYALRDGSATRYTIQALDTAGGTTAAVFELASGDAKICRDVAASGAWPWTVAVNYQYLDCDFTGTGCAGGDTITAWLTASAP